MRSIERHLVAWVLGASSLGALLLGLVAYLVILEDLNDALDENLKQVAISMGRPAHSAGAPGAATQPQLSGADPSPAEIVTARWTPAGQRTYASDPSSSLPFVGQAGFSRVSDGKVDWDVYTLVGEAEIVQVAQRAAAQQEEAAEAAAKLFPPFVALLAVVGGMLIYALRRGLRPLDAAASEVAARSVASLEPMDDHGMPREIQPLVQAMNGLMQRLSVAFTNQQRFVADAAHELRSPVTALRLQLQNLESAPDEAARQEAIGQLREGIDRAQHLLEQLLNLSRAEPGAGPQAAESIPLAELARLVVSKLCVKADHRQIDLGADLDDDVRVRGDREQLVILLNNLVENALRYTPPGGVVDVCVGLLEGRPALRVTDNGPGVPESERDAVFDRFRRGEAASSDGQGSGLGLAIVKAVAQRHGATVTLLTATAGTGLEARVVFPPEASRDVLFKPMQEFG